jgi:glycosyltransferase involved in cell wall biosynthesis
MKLLVVSHSCVTSVNQEFFAEVEQQTGWTLTLAAPATWPSEYGQYLELGRWPAFQGELVPLPVWNAGSVPFHVYRSLFTGLLRRVDPDLIYMHHEPYAAATAQVYIANRWSVQRPIGFFTWQNIQKRYPPPFRQLEQMVFRQSCFAVSGSASARAVLRAKGYGAAAPVIPAGIDPSLYTDDPERDAPPFEKEPSEVVIGFLGRVAEEKGLRTLLKALARLRDRLLEEDVPWRLVVVGAGPFEEAFDEQAAALGLADRVERTGYVPHTEAPRYLAAFDMLVIPSETQSNWKEQFGRVIIEAMACGTPVVGSDSGEIPHLIEATGGGVAVPEGQPEALADGLAKLLRQPPRRRALAEAGRETVLQKYTHAALARRFAATVERAASEDSKHVPPTKRTSNSDPLFRQKQDNRGRDAGKKHA